MQQFLKSCPTRQQYVLKLTFTIRHAVSHNSQRTCLVPRSSSMSAGRYCGPDVGCCF